MRDIAAGAMSLVSWKTLALVLAFLNLKNLPFVWHVGVRARALRGLFELTSLRMRGAVSPRTYPMNYTADRAASSAFCITS